MDGVGPKFSRSQVNRAGEILVHATIQRSPRNTPDLAWAKQVLVDWRASHNYPINTFQSTLRKKLGRIDTDALVAQRLKRAPSILQKLQDQSHIKLARMQDIGGLRAVVADNSKVYRLIENYRRSHFAHELVREDDYIEHPKPSGYRSIHLVYKYRSQHPSARGFDGLRVELQVRSRIQHAWANAVETVGMLLGEPLKAGRGSMKWLEFFAVTSAAFAHIEGTTSVPAYSKFSATETYELVGELANELSVREVLQAYKLLLTHRPEGSWGYYLVMLNTSARQVWIRPFGKGRAGDANAAYAAIERQIEDGEPLQVVLVSTRSLEQLLRSYPSFFLDTNEFITQLDLIIARSR